VAVVPIIKKGNSALVANYKLILTLNYISKTFKVLYLITFPSISNLNYTEVSVVLLN
jgi:hypothetical protein